MRIIDQPDFMECHKGFERCSSVVLVCILGCFFIRGACESGNRIYMFKHEFNFGNNSLNMILSLKLT